MSEAIVWRRDGQLELEWPEGKHTIAITREALQSLIDEVNKQVELRAVCEQFLGFASATFTNTDELMEQWNDTCDFARSVLGVEVST